MTTTEAVPSPIRPTGMIETFDPRSMQVTGAVPDLDAAAVQAAVGRARAAWPAWRDLPFRTRADHLLAVRDVLLDRAEELLDVVVGETGKVRPEAVVTELFPTCELIGHYVRHGEEWLRPEKVPTGTMVHKRAFRRYEPLGVIGVISPWNYPFTLSMTPVVSALLAGNTVVLKPSEVTPLVGLFIGELFASMPEHRDVVHVVTGGGATGDALVRSGVQKICFTGSVATGKRVMAAAADSLTPVVLELGGKDPMIVCADADLDRAAKGAVWGAFMNAGQTCMSVERVYVEAPVYDAFVDKVVTATQAIRQGAAAGDDIGSMTFPRQVEIVERHVADAVDKGATVLTGGQRVPDRPGLWYEPTVLVDVDHTMAVMRDETFGPVLPIMRVRSEAEAVELANDSPYGLNSSVWTANAERGERIAGAIDAGTVCVNECIVSYGVAALPFGGVKESGMGRVHGPEGLREFSSVKSVLVDRGWLGREAWWYPLPRRLGPALLGATRLLYRRGAGAKLRGLTGSGRRRAGT